jgi:hypothetical protein
MIKHVFTHLRQNVIAYFALFVALGGTSYASVKVPQQLAAAHSAKTAKAGVTCGGRCPASRVYWAYVGATSIPGYGPTGDLGFFGAPAVYETAIGGVPATVQHLGTGDWLVSFTGQDLRNCGRFANLTHDRGSASVSGFDSTNQWNTYDGGIHVMTTDASGKPADLDFNVLAVCGLSQGHQIGAAAPATGGALASK